MILNRATFRGSAIALAFLASACQSGPRLADLPPPPPPPASEPSPARLVQAPGPWGVFFDLDRADLRPEAMPILDLVVDAYQKFGRSVVNIDGHGDTTGRSPYNLALGERRSEAVKAYLVSKGIPSRIIRTSTEGEHDLLVPTPDDVLERRNRRVEITFAPA